MKKIFVLIVLFNSTLAFGAKVILNTVPYPTNKLLNTSTTQSKVEIANLATKTLNITATLHGSAVWENENGNGNNKEGGVQLKNLDGDDYIYLQPKNITGAANFAKYTLNFPAHVSDLSFVISGLNFNDACEITAYDSSNKIIALNLSHLSEFDKNNSWSKTDLGDAVKVVGTNGAGGSSIQNNSFKTTITGPVSSVVIKAYKDDNTSFNGTMGLTDFDYTVVEQGVNYWLGTISSDWNNASNWSAKKVPASKQDITFATSQNNAGNAALKNLHIPAKAAMEIGNLTNLSTKALVIPAGAGLYVRGKVTGSEASPDKIILKASADGSAPNASFVVDCAKNASTTIQATVQLYANGYKGSQQTWVDNIPGSPTFGQSFSSSYKWQYFGVPVTAIKADPSFSGAFLREYNEEKNAANSYYNKWNDLNNNSTLTAFKGYSITQNNPQIYELKGKLAFCDKEITLTRNAPLVSGSTDANINNKRYGLGQNIIGNSFTTAIPIEDIDFDNIKVNGVSKSNADGKLVEKTIYLYNTGSFGDWSGAVAGNNVTTAGSYLAIPKNIGSTIYKQIPSMQGFLLRHTGAIGSTITMTLPYGKSTLSTTKQTAPQQDYPHIELELTSKSTNDKLWLFEVDGTSTKFDNGWDGLKFFGTPTAFIYATTEAGNMQVNTSNSLLGASIAFVPTTDETYKLTIRKSNVAMQHRELYLLDLEAKKSVLLADSTTEYRFTARANSAASLRFVVSNKPNATASNANTDLNAYVIDRNLQAINNTNQAALLEVTNPAGQLILSKKVNALAVYHQTMDMPTGVYVVRMRTANQSFAQKILIR